MEPLPTPTEMLDPVSDPLEASVVGAAAGDPGAWESLMVQLEPLVARLSRRRGRLDVDGHRDVYLRVIDRLQANGGRALSRYLETRERYPELGFAGYLAAVVGSAVIDHVRARPESVRRRCDNARRLATVQLRPLDAVAEPSSSADVAAAVEVRRILARLTDARFPVAQRRALLLWLHGHDAGEIADELGLDNAAAANRLLRAARERLRRAVRNPR